MKLKFQEFKTLDVLSKLEGLWLNRNQEIMYAGVKLYRVQVYSRIKSINNLVNLPGPRLISKHLFHSKQT